MAPRRKQIVHRKIKEEHAIARMKLYQRNDAVIEIEREFAPLFHGRTLIPYGEYLIKYPIRDLEMNRLVTKFQIQHREFTLKEGIAGYEVC
jgi:hypothetical protein